ncbi:MAG TPA: IPT/TIG domain-containing protein [Terriglobales bacterium]|nr:IPT/TIG domain-containing protein [Terriglobales bacterium]
MNDHCRGLIDGPKIDRLRPNTGPVGTVVTITGRNFGTPPQGTTVAGTVVFNGNAQATPTSWADNQIVVTVPAGATTGDVVLNVAEKTDNKRFTIR